MRRRSSRRRRRRRRIATIELLLGKTVSKKEQEYQVLDKRSLLIWRGRIGFQPFKGVIARFWR